MAVPGRKQKPEDQRRNRHPPAHDWTEVLNAPYDGPRPKLPTRYRAAKDSAPVRASWPARTKAWWETVSRMPHCSLWSEADWDFALDTAEVHARFVEGGGATELRIRESRMGTTLDARRDLRIRYVAASPATLAEAERPPAGVVKLDDWRDLYG